MSRPDFALVGAGLCGRLLAWRLAAGGARVELYEQGPADGSSAAAWVAAAMLAPLAEAAVAEPLLVELGVASLTRWPEIIAALPLPVFFQRNGTLAIWHAADRAEADLFERRVRANSPASLHAAGLRALHGAEIEQLEPALGRRFERALFLPDEGQLDNRQVLAALGAGLREHGVTIHSGVTVGPHDWPEAGVSFDCRGLGAKDALPGLRGIRGEVARVQAPGVGLSRPVRLLHPRYPLYVAPKQDDLYVIGATEIEGDDRSPMSVRSALELLSALYTVHPSFGEARILELNSQVRPTLPDHRPSIGWDGRRRISVNGLYRHGYMISPAVTEQAANLALALAGGTILDRDDFDGWRERTPWPELFEPRGAMSP